MNPPPQDSASWPLVLAAVLAVALVVTGVMALRYRRAACRGEGRTRVAEDRIRAAEERCTAAEERYRALRHEYDIREAEDRYLVEKQVPALVQALWEGRDVELPAPLHTSATGGSAFADTREDALQQVHQASVMVAERAEEGAKAVVSTVTRSMQGLLNDTTNAIDAMLRRHDDPEVLADATNIDHASNQLVRRTQVINVLTGSWPGRQRRSSPLLDVVRGGVSKIRDYDRIKITGAPAYSVVSQAVEPMVLAVAELLDNAARHSEPGSDVQVWFVQAHNGVSVMIDDSGVGLRPEAREQAARQLSGEEEVRLTQMGSRPKFGFSVVGVLARRYGFKVSVDQESIYGGVRAGIFLPSAILTPPESAEPQPPRAHGRAADARLSAGAADEQGHVRSGEPVTGATGEADIGGDATGHDVSRQDGTRPRVPGQAAAARSENEESPREQTAEPTERTAAAREQSAGDDLATRPDGLPQRRRRTVRQDAAQDPPAAQPPSNSSRNVGAFARGIRGARERRTSDERTTEK